MEVIRNFSDPELLANLREGKRIDDSIKALYRDHFESLAWYIMNNNGSREDAEDVFQEVVLAFIDCVQKNKFRGESSVKTFLYSLNRHTWLNELKRRSRAMVREEKFEKEKAGEEPDVSVLVAERDARAEMLKLVGSLGDACKKILVGFYYEGLSMKEILATLDYENEQVVRNKKYKCLKQLEQMIIEKPFLKDRLKTLLHG